jgi:hypothetical protein
VQHGVYTFVFTVEPARRLRLDRLLAGWAPDGAASHALGFAANDDVHFASVTVFEREFLDPLLVIECNFDGGLEAFVTRFVSDAGGLEAVLECVVCPPGHDPHDVAARMKAAAVKPIARHLGAYGLTRNDILRGEDLAAQARDYLFKHQARLCLADAPAVAAELQREFKAKRPPCAPPRTGGELAIQLAPAAITMLVLAYLAWTWPWFALAALGGVAALAVIVGLSTVIFLRAEAREPVRERPQPREDLAARNENRPGTVQNHFSSIAPLKTGPVRWASLRIFMWLLNQIARLVFTKGELGGIPSIHFAHWSVIDRGASLLFVSNYGGTWEGYLDDFIQRAANGVTLVWSHCRGFPAARWLVMGGARNEKAFKRYARDSQSAEALWYAAYPHLTTRRINNNRAIMAGLAGVSKEPPERWLARI